MKTKDIWQLEGICGTIIFESCGRSGAEKKVPEKKQLNESDGTYEQIAVKLRRILSKTDICSETDVCYFSVSRK